MEALSGIHGKCDLGSNGRREKAGRLVYAIIGWEKSEARGNKVVGSTETTHLATNRHRQVGAQLAEKKKGLRQS
jgi:hypothetical protein